MKKLLSSLFILLLFMTSVIAQERIVTGTVKGKDDGLPLPGVSVRLKGSTTGTQTGANGQFSIRIPGNNAVLVFTYIGYASQDVAVGSRSTLNVTLGADANQLTEVVVTALGISREKRALGYSATSVDNEQITRTAPISMLEGLQGKIAGANITSQSGSPGASTKVILRGYASVNGNNQPLYVIDGVPVDNGQFGNGQTGSAEINRTSDFGNNANDINPNDIESINILKGAAASSLYGSRAANGVIVITTKKGKAGKLNIDVNSAATFSSALMLPKLQEEFGQGWSGKFAFNENGSWGPKFDGQNRLWGNVVDNHQQFKPFSALPNKLRDFYDMGSEYNNSISLSGGTEQSTFYLSYGNVTSDGIIPMGGDTYDRNTLSLRGSTKYHGLSASASLNYVAKRARTIATGQGSNEGATLFQELIQIPTDISIVDLKNYANKYNDVDNYFTPYAQNPYFILGENGNNFNSDRVYGNVNLDYNITDWLSASARIGSDVTNSRLKDWQAISRPASDSPNSSRQADVGGVKEEGIYRREINGDFMLNFNKNINDDFDFDGMIGYNFNQRDLRRQTSSISALTIPGFYELSNSSAPPTATTSYSKRRLMGAYGQANFSYKNYLYLSLNARNDWSSTLPIGKNSFFYPAANLSFVVSDLVENLDQIGVSFLKLRAGWGKTGNDAPAYSVFSTLAPGDILLGFGNIKFPLSGVSGFEVSNIIGNSSLQPEITREVEFGADIRFFKNRLGIDAAFYDKVTTDQIFNVPIAATTGYRTLVTNFGKIQNKGIELSVTGTPIKSTAVTWDVTYTFARNRNLVKELPAGLDEVVINNGYDVDFVAMEGRPLGVFKGPVEATDPDGRIIVNATNGLPLQSSERVEYGDSQQKFVMGLTNRVTYKDWSLGFSFDYRKGGLFWSYTSQLNYFVGNADRTTYNDRNPYIIPNSVNQITDATGKVSYVENATPISKENINTYWSPGDNTQTTSRNTMIDRTFLKMRDVTLSYAFPKGVASKIKASNLVLTAYGRNLFIWVPSSNTFIDPEVNTYNNDLRGELGEFAGGPTTRSYGLSLRASF